MSTLSNGAKLVVALGILASCDVSSETTLDTQLEEALEVASNGEGSSHFLLPDSDDLSQIPQDPNNPLTSEKVQLGQLLYHETGLAINPKYAENAQGFSCASCHHAAAGFQAGVIQGIAEGGWGFGSTGEARDKNTTTPGDSLDVQPIRSPSILNAAYQEVMLWNGQFGATGMNEGTDANWAEGTPKFVNHLGYQGIESQAIAGLTVHRMGVDMDLINNTEYKAMFDAAFGDFAEGERYTLETTGLAIAAYERTVLANQSPFQRWLRGDKDAMTEDQKVGAALFFGKANCASCHNGPSLANMEFYALGMDDLPLSGTYGSGVDEPTKYGRGGFTGNPNDNYTFKVPQLYSLGYSKFYGHGGTFTSVQEVIEYKNAAVPSHGDVPAAQLAADFTPLNLTDEEIAQLTEFVENGLNDASLDRYTPSSIPSGNCFPNNDEQSRIDLGCQ